MHPAVKILPNYSYEDYCLWEGRWEVIDGIPYAMSPAPNPRHQMVAAALMGELRNSLKAANCKKCKVYDFIDYKVTEHTILQPDILIVCKPIEKNYLDFAPALVVEILSPATAMKDRNNKFTIYQSQKIPYYIIIDADKKEIEIYSMKDETYQRARFDADELYTFNFTNGCAAEVKMSEIWN